MATLLTAIPAAVATLHVTVIRPDRPSRSRLALCTGLVLLATAACERSSSETKDDKPIALARIALGECGGADAIFESGPMPHPAPLIRDTALARFASSLAPAPPDVAAQQTGILGVLQQDTGGAFASLTGTADFSSGLDDKDVYGGLLGNDLSGTGGFGYGAAGTDPAGGGTGWGTIGQGKYGIIGHGSGTGSGYGSGMGRGAAGSRATPPQVRIGNATATGDLDKNIIRRYIRRKLPRIRHCYEKQLLVEPSLAGTVVARFQITPTGAVQEATARGMGSAEVESCIAETIGSIQFPKPRGGGLVNVSYPFTFRTGGSSAPPPAAVDDPPEPEPVRAAATEPAPSANKGSDTPPPSLLESAREEIGACLSPTLGAGHGVMVVEMKAAKDGTVTVSRTTGGGGDRERECVTQAAGSVRVEASDEAQRVYRCPLAYGEMHVDESLHVDVADGKVRLTTRTVAATDELTASGDDAWKLEELSKALGEHRVHSEKEARTALVSVTGPVVLRPAPATSARIVYRALKTALDSGSATVLAADRSGEWKLLRDLSLPVVPVPRGTGGTWGGVALDQPAIGTRSEHALSILLGKDDIWIGNTGATQLHLDGDDLRSLPRALRRVAEDVHLESPVVEVAAADDVPYSTIVAVLDRIGDVDEADWVLVDPKALSVPFKTTE